MDIWKVIDTYFKSNEYYFTRHHIDSYNDFVINKIPYIIKTLNPFVIVKEDSKFRVEVHISDKVNVCNPTYDSDKLLYPNAARLQNKNYFCDIRTDIEVTYFEEEQVVNKELFTNRKIGSIPILLHSKLCYLKGLDVDTLQSLGECQYDQGGYFIVDGKEKVIISQERIATNQLFISDPSDPALFKLEGMIRSTSLSNALFPKSVHFWVEKDTLRDPFGPKMSVTEKMENSFFVTMKIMNINLERIPIFTIFRALGVESDKDILDYIALNDEELKQHLRSSIVNASKVLSGDRPVYTQKDALQYLSNFVKHSDVHFAQYVIINDLFPNVGDDFRQKAMYLGYLVNKLIRTTIGTLKQNKRDNYMFKRVDTTGILLGNIFRDFYNKYRNNIRSMIDREYTLGGTNNRLKLVNEGNFNRVFPSAIIGDGMYKSMKGNWGLTGDPSQQGIVQDVSRLSYIGYVSHVRRVNTPIDRSIKLVEPHRLDSPQWGMMCPIESPDGANIGLLKHMAVTCEITLESDRDQVVQCLTDLHLIPLEDVNPYTIRDYCKIHLNNNWLGVHPNPKELMDQLKEFRRTGVLNAFVSISWNVIDNEIMLYSDSGRCCRPLIIADGFQNLNYEAKTWKDLVNGYTYEYTYDKGVKNKPAVIEYVDCFETNTLYIAMTKNDIKENRHTHVEIHPCLCMSMYTNTIPFANHNQAPRNVFSGQQGKQAVGIYATNFNHRIDTASYILHYPQRSLLSTKMAKYTFKNKMPNGENLIVAIATYTGYNQEDSIILNKSSIERGMFNVSYFKSVVDSEDENIQSNTKVVFDNPTRLKKEGKNIDFKYANWDVIDDNGLPIKNKYISEQDCYLGKVNMEMKRMEDSDKAVFNDQVIQHVYTDKSKIADKTVSGTIDKVLQYDHNGMQQVKIRLRKFRIPELGDKMASSHGQKGVCGMILPQEDMPYNKDGLVPDIIVNPHAFPSRMTIAHLIESVLAKLCCLKGSYIDGTAFENHCIDDYYSMMKKHQYQQYGDELLYNGFTGEQIQTEIFIGPTYYYRLKHMVKDKINYRGIGGPVEMMTKQPTQGRSNGGGLRIGEMETNAILAHGITGFVKETMMERSDGYHKFIDGETGEDIIYNEKEQFYDSLNAKKIEIPYSMKLLKQEVEGLGINMKLSTKNV
uniref:DNA-directed RNA polymerase subunit beta n=1 Tax=Pyramimonas orientalis virus TaxID=455367 RepID=A0A7M3UNY6_POV01|nr:DNA-directed RNA polymerase subunit 2 [Pyramimonas orientalis virus]